MNALEIEVTVEDILNGERANTYCCPIALAASRQMRSYQAEQIQMALEFGCNMKSKPFKISVFRTDLRLDYEGCTRIFNLPDSAIIFSNDFDAKKNVQPFKFIASLDYKY